MRRVFSLAVIVVAALLVAATVGVTRGGLDATATAATAQSGPGAATAGCGKAPGLASGTHTIQSSGTTRSYILELPSNYDPNHPSRRSRSFGLSEWRTAEVTEPAPHRLYRASASACFVLGPGDQRLPVRIGEHE